MVFLFNSAGYRATKEAGGLIYKLSIFDGIDSNIPHGKITMIIAPEESQLLG